MEWKQSSGTASTAEQRKAKIAALLRERRSYEVRGDENGVAQVDAELKRLGHEAAAPAKRAERRPASSPATEKR